MGSEAIVVWVVLLTVLVLVASGRFRFELAALGGLFFLGITGVAEPEKMFLGLGHPAVITIGAVFIISRGITESGLLSGLGLFISDQVRSQRSQILSLSAVTSVLSAFMNNVGAIGLIMPTSLRMARRSGLSKGAYGLPLAYASILGGSSTLIGSAPNIIVSTSLAAATGQGFRMFDFVPYGLIMTFSGLFLWVVCRFCGFTPGTWKEDPELRLEKASEQEENLADQGSEQQKKNDSDLDHPWAQPGLLLTPQRRRTLVITGSAIAIIAAGTLSPAVVFGTAAFLLIILKVLSVEKAYQSLSLSILIFLGAMLGISSILEEVGGLQLLGSWLLPFWETLPRFVLLGILFFISSFLSNILNNSASAAVMAPVALTLGSANAPGDLSAMMMAVAMGANLAVIMPTHQATLMVLAGAPFSISTFMKGGIVLTLVAGTAVVAMINLLL